MVSVVIAVLPWNATVPALFVIVTAPAVPAPSVLAKVVLLLFVIVSSATLSTAPVKPTFPAAPASTVRLLPAPATALLKVMPPPALVRLRFPASVVVPVSKIAPPPVVRS